MKARAAVGEIDLPPKCSIPVIAPKVIENATASATTEGALCTPWMT
mgnify:CR=1 FL=1